MGAFDDLIPQRSSGGSSGSFADLIPQKNVAAPQSFIQRLGSDIGGMATDLTGGLGQTAIEQTLGRVMPKSFPEGFNNLPRGNQFLSGIGQAVAKPINQSYNAVVPNFPLTPKIPAQKIAASGGLGLLGLLAQKYVPETVQPTQHQLANSTVDIATNPSTFLLSGGVGKTMDVVEGAAKAVAKPIKLVKTAFSKAEINPKLIQNAANTFKTRVASMHPDALIEAGVDPSDVGKLSEFQKQYGWKKLPSEPTAESFYNQTFDLPSNKPIDIADLSGALSEAASAYPMGKSNPFRILLDKLTKSTNLNEMVLGKNTVDLVTYKSFLKQINALEGADKGAFDDLVRSAREGWYKSAQNSGINSSLQARDMFHASKLSGKANDLLQLPHSDVVKKIETLVKGATQEAPYGAGAKGILEATLGQDSMDILSNLKSVSDKKKAQKILKLFGLAAGTAEEVGIGVGRKTVGKLFGGH